MKRPARVRRVDYEAKRTRGYLVRVQRNHCFTKQFFSDSVEPALPVLFEPQLLAIGDDVVLLRGYERVKDGNGSITVLQEWRCEPA